MPLSLLKKEKRGRGIRKEGTSKLEGKEEKERRENQPTQLANTRVGRWGEEEGEEEERICLVRAYDPKKRAEEGIDPDYK